MSAATARSLRPDADALVDGAAALVLTLLALVGALPIFDAGRAVLIGLVAALVAVVVVHLAAASRLRPFLFVVATAGAFLLAAGPAVPDDAFVGGLLPGPGTPWAALDGVVTGWSEVITTAPPVALSGGLGVVPYACGFVAAGGAMLLARKTGTALLPAAPPLVAVAALVALGTRDPASVLLQGGAFVAVALGWAAHRAHRPRREPDSHIHWPRLAAAAAMVVVVVVVGLVCGPMLPFTGGERVVAREQVVPPFDPRDYPSPLAGFRNHRTESGQEQVLFRVEGLEAGTPVRLAVMDTYDGVVWAVGGEASGTSGRFVRVGRDILPVPDGPNLALDVEVDGYSGVWVPTVGATRSIAFGGEQAGGLTDAFRYNRETAAGATPLPLVGGDRFRLDARATSIAVTEREAAEADGVSTAPVDATVSLPPLEANDVIDRVVADQVDEVTTPYEQAVVLETWLQEGYYSDGDDDGTGRPRPASGHSIFRLERFLSDSTLVGNDEQYAAAMAYMARRVGLPARVVLGLRSADPGVLRGSDVEAWVEIAFQGHGWLPFFPTPEESRVPPETPPVPKEEEELAQQEPPPNPYVRPPDTTPKLDDPRRRTDEVGDGSGGLQIPGWLRTVGRILGPPALLLGSIVGGLAGSKAWRRRRRRLGGTPVDRIAGAWHEITDRVRDLGTGLPARATRHEVASVVPHEVWPAAVGLAAQVDGLMFGPADPDDDAARAVWVAVDEHRRALGAELGPWARVRALLNPVSLRRMR